MKQAALALVLAQDAKVLAVSRKDNHNDLGFPGGKVEPDETLEAAMCREMEEETGLRPTSWRKLYEGLDDTGTYATTFLLLSYEGTPDQREAGIVVWVPKSRLLEPSCSWPDYNRRVFDALGAG